MEQFKHLHLADAVAQSNVLEAAAGNVPMGWSASLEGTITAAMSTIKPTSRSHVHLRPDN